MQARDMKQPALFKNSEAGSSSHASIILNKEKIAYLLGECITLDEFALLRNKVLNLKGMMRSYKYDKEGILNIDSNGDTISMRRDVLLSELDQILEARTLRRAKYYLKRLKAGVEKVKTNKVNDINLLRWKEYDEIITDSLWIFDRRDASGAHLGWYWGNFIPQIPHQMILRYTKKGEWVLDTFVGSGTTLIECKRLGRNGIGIELNLGVARKARELIKKENNKFNVTTEVVIGDSRTIDIKSVLNRFGIKRIQLLIMHPPYYDIIKFSKDKRDLSNARSVDEFLKMFGKVVDNAISFLEKGRYFALVMGDKYSKGEWIPLGFYCMQKVLERGCLLKSIIVKNFEQTRAKRTREELWRYRALASGFYIFKHEYIFLFKKR